MFTESLTHGPELENGQDPRRTFGMSAIGGRASTGRLLIEPSIEGAEFAPDGGTARRCSDEDPHRLGEFMRVD
jgi:hypothetical protein